MIKSTLGYFTALLVFLFLFLYSASNTIAVNDPLAFDNNKIGIGLLSPDSEIGEASDLVNSSGGSWGYVLLVIRRDEMDVSRWQGIFDKLNQNRLIPIVRLATQADGLGNWEKPKEEDARNWANFLDSLYWPINNRYVQVYNEVNSAHEWGGQANPEEYANELSKTIEILKSKNENFFILNSALDLARSTSGGSIDAAAFFFEMHKVDTEIFNKIDGWASHSYPNPGFVAPPTQKGRLGIDGYQWEQNFISQYQKREKMPVFITETGWKRSIENQVGLEDSMIADYWKYAFENVWNDPNIIAVTPFILSYPDSQHYAFSFKRRVPENGKAFFDGFYSIWVMPKNKGDPYKSNSISHIIFNYPEKILVNSESSMSLRIKNEGNHIWDNSRDLSLVFVSSSAEILDRQWENTLTLPGQDAILNIKIKTLEGGQLPMYVKISSKGTSLKSSTINLNSLNQADFLMYRLKNIVNLEK